MLEELRKQTIKEEIKKLEAWEKCEKKIELTMNRMADTVIKR